MKKVNVRCTIEVPDDWSEERIQQYLFGAMLHSTSEKESLRFDFKRPASLNFRHLYFHAKWNDTEAVTAFASDSKEPAECFRCQRPIQPNTIHRCSQGVTQDEPAPFEDLVNEMTNRDLLDDDEEINERRKLV